MPISIGDNMVIVPVANAQVGWIRSAVGIPGVGGAANIVTLFPEEIPSALFAVTIYGPDPKPLNVKPAWYPLPIL